MIFGIYLAAGQSKRMGCPKLPLPLGEKPLGSIALQTALESALDKIIIVTREEDNLQWLPPNLFYPHFQKKWIHIRCKESVRGQAESLKCGLTAAQNMQAKAVMILLADQPFIHKKTVNHLLSLYRKEKPKYVASCFRGLLRPPVILDSSLFSDVWQLQGDQGARRIIRNSPQGLVVECKDRRNFLDVDTPIHYKSLQESLSKESGLYTR